MPLNFSDLLAIAGVHIDVSAGSKKHALQILSDHLAETTDEATSDDIFDALIERERLGCTAAESGLAIPHSKLDEISAPHAVLVRLQEPVDFDAGELPPVDLLFGFIAPKDSSEELAEDLRALTQTIADPGLVERLRAATTGDDIYALLAAATATATATAHDHDDGVADETAAKAN